MRGTVVVVVATCCLAERSSEVETTSSTVHKNVNRLTPLNGALIPGGFVHVIPGVFRVGAFIPIFCWFLVSFGFHWWSFPILEWSFMSKLSTNWVSEEFRSPDWSGLLTTGLLVTTDGTAWLSLLVEIGCKISWKGFSKETLFQTENKILDAIRFGADGSNRFCDDGVANENRSSTNNCSWPFDAGLDEEKRSASLFNVDGEVASFFYKTRVGNHTKSSTIPTLLNCANAFASSSRIFCGSSLLAITISQEMLQSLTYLETTGCIGIFLPSICARWFSNASNRLLGACNNTLYTSTINFNSYYLLDINPELRFDRNQMSTTK